MYAGIVRNTTHAGDCLSLLRTFPDNSIHCCVTSPPYWGLRDYGAEGQIGLEPTPDAYVDRLVEVFREVHRVLRPDGTLWLNIGDSYTAGGMGGHAKSESFHGHLGRRGLTGSKRPPAGMKSKDLVLIPYMVAAALREDGWWLRSDIIWHKPSCMPESVEDRPTNDFEHIFLLAKSDRYFYDAEAIREPSVEPDRVRSDQVGGNKGTSVHHSPGGVFEGNPRRNRRAVWPINPKPYKGAHFAVFPPELPELCIKAGTSEKGCCLDCGAPRRRRIHRPDPPRARDEVLANVMDGGLHVEHGMERTGMSHYRYSQWLQDNPPSTLGWDPSCTCGNDTSAPCIVLDPFAGSGTTLAVAKWLGRDYVGIELNPEYAGLIQERIEPALEYQSQKSVFDLAMGQTQDD